MTRARPAAVMSPRERIEEVAGILAIGILRLRDSGRGPLASIDDGEALWSATVDGRLSATETEDAS